MATRKNRFEQVDEIQADAINLTLSQKSDGQVGTIHCPKTAAPDRLSADLISEEAPARDAVIGAIELAKQQKTTHRRHRSRQNLETGMGGAVAL